MIKTDKPQTGDRALEMSQKGIKLLLLLHTTSAVKLQAYDCSMRNGAKFSEVSLLDVAPCNNVSARYEKGERTEIQVLQEIKTKAIEMIHCQLRVCMETAYCGKGVYTRV